MAGRSQQPQRGGTRGGTAVRERRRDRDQEGIIPQLAKAVREVEGAARRGRLRPSARTTFQVVALLVREERARVKADTELGEAWRTEQLKRLDGVATILAKTAALDTSVIPLLGDDAEVSEDARIQRREMYEAAGLQATPLPGDRRHDRRADRRNDRRPEGTGAEGAEEPEERRAVPPSVVARQLANPFLLPDHEAAERRRPVLGRLSSWELLEPLFRAFEEGGGSACMELPEPAPVALPDSLELMPHQARLVAAARAGHREFLLADEPGLGKTAQALLAAQAADAYPLLAVVPNVVKTSWAREARLWTPQRQVTVVHGDGEDVDGFADIVVVNYDILDRHVDWLADLGLRGIVVDEAHFIKNKGSQRSRNVLHLADRVRARIMRPLVMALTGTPLINDIEDFQAIWELLGWIDEERPLGPLMRALEDTGLTPADRAFYPAARQAVVDLGIVRRRKVDVAADIPARRVADLPVELDDEASRDIRAAERRLARRLVRRYDAALVARLGEGTDVARLPVDTALVRQVAEWEREGGEEAAGENVFALMRRIGRAKSGLAADYAAQLSHNVGKVVFFAKHVDVMDAAEETFARRGIRYASVRGDQTRTARQDNVDAFVQDPEVAVAVCSLTAAGVGLNLQVASDVVLAELSWTAAEQTQAIDRVHRIGQDRPVTAWRVIASQTVDTRVAELIDSKAGLAARALDGSDDEVTGAVDVQLEALVDLLARELAERAAA